MIIVTGAAGFIGSQIINRLNQQGQQDILAVDNLTDGTKFKNLASLKISDYMDKHDFLAFIQAKKTFPEKVECVFHQGACSNTTEWNGLYMMQNNYDYSKYLLDYCVQQNAPFLYASSAAVYGEGRVFKEELQYEGPVNLYGYSKFLFDQYIRRKLSTTPIPIIGLRYFNVYGPNETHKGRMSSVAFHFNRQIKEQGLVRLFEGSDEFGPGEQRRDFVYVEDVANVNVWFFNQIKDLGQDAKHLYGIFNVGTGRSQSFKEVAEAVIAYHGTGQIEYIPFPDDLRGRYQSFTEADISNLTMAGYSTPFKTVQEGVASYLALIQ